MAEFLKLDLVDTEESIISTIEAKDLKSLIKSELKRYKVDDRLESCLEGPRAKQFSTSGNSIKWLPGDGSWPTIAVYLESPGCFDNGNVPTRDEIREYFKDFI
jgi:hypothetical protein